MIVPFKKIIVLCRKEDIDNALSHLRDLGVVHLEKTSNKQENADIETKKNEYASCLRAIDILTKTIKTNETDVITNEIKNIPPLEIISKIENAKETAAKISEKLGILQKELNATIPFQNISPARISSLTENGLFVKFFRKTKKTKLQRPQDAVELLFYSDSSEDYIMVISTSDFSCKGGIEVSFPHHTLADIQKEISALNQLYDDEISKLKNLSQYLNVLQEYAESIHDEIVFMEAKNSMTKHSEVAYLTGFVPAESVGTLKQNLFTNGMGFMATNPSPADRVPTLLKMPRWVKPIESLFQLIKILPGYREVDVSAAFLLFMSLFFAMIIGDAGYGLIFLLTTLFLRRKIKNAHPQPFQLMYIFSIATIIWGIIAGSYFGLTTLPLFFEVLNQFRLTWLTDNKNVMHLCLYIGAIHLSIAHLWNVIRYINSTLALAQVGWITITWTMFFVARSMILGILFPKWYIPFAICGIILVLLFMTPWKKLKSEWVNHLMLPLTLMSNFGDILSYLRLFALNVAGLQLAGAFNSMALSLGLNSPIRVLGSAFILFIGHSLNIALGSVSVLVHAVRLNALEFSMHFGLEWAGIPYEPFKKKVETKNSPVLSGT